MRPHPATTKTETKPEAAKTPRASSRRARYLLQTSVLLLAITAVCMFVVLLATRHPMRFDVTATRSHALSPRTTRILDGLQAPHEILVTTNAATIDPAALERTTDVLTAFRRASPNVRVSLIDVGAGAGGTAERGQAELDDALSRLGERYRTELTTGTTGIVQTAVAVRAAVPEITAIGDQLQRANDGIPETDENAAAIKRFLSDSATVARVSVTELTESANRAETLAKGTIPHTPIPPVDTALRTLRSPLSAYLQQIEQISEGTLAIANSTAKGVPPQAKNAAAPLATALQKHRDRIARLVLDLDQLPRTPLPEATRVLMSTSAALVIAPPPPATGASPANSNAASLRGVTALDIQSILPLRMSIGGAAGDPLGADGTSTPRPDLRFRAEELFAGALATLSTPNAPIVCIVHGAPETERLAPEYKPLGALVQRLALRGIDMVEWPAAAVNEPPTAAIASLDPMRSRPVVYIVVPTNALSGEAGAMRSKKLAEAVGKLVQTGKPVLFSFNPSNLPAIGQKDPMAEPLAPLGVSVDTGHPLLMRLTNPAAGAGAPANIVTPDLFITRTDSEHAVAAAAQSLRTYLSWALPMVIDPTAQSASGTTITPLITIPADPKIWGESEWLGFRQTPASQRPMLVNPPMPDSSRDDQEGPWVVAAAIERPLVGAMATGGSVANKTQRLIAVGSNGWFFDEFTQVAAGADASGRALLRNPGNLELFDACVSWLAGQEDLIARSAEAQSVATIPDLSRSTLMTLRWALILGMPLAVLGLGVLWRLMRG